MVNTSDCPGYDPLQKAECFKGHGCVMSNMYPCEFPYGKLIVKSSEHAYQYDKALALNKPDVARAILETDDGYAAKRLADEKFSNRNDKALLKHWRVNQGVTSLENILQSKFEHVEEFKEALIASEGKLIIEATYDTFWGVGFLEDIAATCRPEYWPGKNKMGMLLMKMRDKYLGFPNEFLEESTIGSKLDIKDDESDNNRPTDAMG